MNQTTNNLIITDSNKFEEIILRLSESLTRMRECFELEKKNMKKIDKTDVWTGIVQEKVYEKYIELSNCYSSIDESLTNYVKFLDNALKSFKAAEASFNSSVDNNDNNLNVN